MFQQLSGWWSARGRGSRHDRRSPQRMASTLEHLENRCLLASDLVFLDSSAGVVYILGTPGKDIVRVTEGGGQLTVAYSHGIQEPNTSFPTSAVRSVQFRGEEGDDDFENRTAVSVIAVGGAGNDRLVGGAGADNFFGGLGNDVLVGGAGNDTLSGEENDDQLFGGLGNDTLFGNAGNDSLYGEAGDDWLLGSGGQDVLLGGSGDDHLLGDADNDSLWGEEGNDELFGDLGHDLLQGGAGVDTLIGGLGIDTLAGGEGNDTLFGDGDNDQLQGDAGDDRLFGGDGHDVLQGGSGRDELHGNLGNDVVWGGSDDDIGHGNEGDDVVGGEAGADSLWGESGNDLLLGGLGSDFLEGGTDQDVLIGGADADLLQGSGGQDLLHGGTMLWGDQSVNYDLTAWNAVRSGWSSPLPYAARIAAVSASTNRYALIPGTTALDDFVTDQLTGSDDLDWFFLVGGNGVQTPTSWPRATLATLDRRDNQDDESTSTNALENVYYPSLTTNGTGDNTEIIQAILEFRDTVYLPPGVIRLTMASTTATLTLGEGQALVGQTDGSTTLQLVTDANNVQPRGIQMSSNTRLENLNISQLGHGGPSHSSIMIYAINASQVSLRKVNVAGPAMNGQSLANTRTNPLYVGNSNHVTIADSLFAGAQGHFGAEFINVFSATILRSEFRHNGWDGLKVHGTTDIPLNMVIDSSSFYDNGRTIPDTGRITNGNGLDMYGRGITIRNSVAYGNYGGGFQVKTSGDLTARDIQFINCQAYGQKSIGSVRQSGFVVWNANYPGAITNISFVNCSSHDNSGSGYWIGILNQSITITNSRADNNGNFGLEMQTTPDVSAIRGFGGIGNQQGLFSAVLPTFACDLTGDGNVDAADANVLFTAWGRTGTSDCNRDGLVDASDAGAMFSVWSG